MLIIDEHLTLRNNNQDDNYLYSSRGNDSDGDDDGRRNEDDVTSNADILQRRGKEYDSVSGTTARQFIGTPQYHLMPTEEEESERRQSAKGQQLERMQRRRNARLNRQSAGFSKTDDLPGFRGKEPLENLISYIDAPAQTSKKSKKKKKKVSTVDNSDAVAEKLANSCGVFVGTSGVSSDEPSVRVGDSCCIELRKKSDFDSLPDTASEHVNPVIYSPDNFACLDSDRSVFISGTVADGGVDADAADSRNDAADTVTSHLNIKLAEDLPEVVYAEVKNTVLEGENVSCNVTESVTLIAALSDETLAVGCEATSGFPEGDGNTIQIATEASQVSVESCSAANMTDSVSSLTAESNAENPVLAAVSDSQCEFDSIIQPLTGSDSITSDAGSVEDLFVTVQKKKRSKNTAAVVAEDPRQRFARRPSNKGVEDRDVGYYTKRSWVKSSDTTAVVPSVTVSRSSIVHSKPSCPVTQRSGPAAARYSQASNLDTVLSSSVAEKCWDIPASSALPVEADCEVVAEQACKGESSVRESTCLSSGGNTNSAMYMSEENGRNVFENDLVVPVTSTLPATAVVSTHWQTSGPVTSVCECSDRTDLTSSDMPTGTGDDEISHVSDVSQKASTEATTDDTLNVTAGIQTDVVANSLDVPSQGGEDQSLDAQTSEGKVNSSQPPVQIVSSCDVFLDTRNIAGTTPPRSDISFGFDPGSYPESSDVSASQHINLPGATFTAAATSCHCPVVAPLPPPVAGCPPILYFYPAMPVTILPPVATYTTGRCTPVGVVPPMPAVADVSNISVAPPAWQATEDKPISVPVQQDGQNTVDNDDTATSDVAAPSTSNKATNKFVLYAAQRYLYSGMLPLCTLILRIDPLRISLCQVVFIIYAMLLLHFRLLRKKSHTLSIMNLLRVYFTLLERTVFCVVVF